MIQIFFSIVFVAVCLVLIGIILIQKGRGGGLTGAFGGGGSETWLGGLQSKEIVRWTTWLAIAFFVLTIMRDMIPPKRVGADVEDLMGATSTPMEQQQPAGDTTAPGAPSAPQSAEAPAPAAGGSSAPVPVAPAGQPAAPPAAPPGQGGAQ